MFVFADNHSALLGVRLTVRLDVFGRAQGLCALFLGCLTDRFKRSEIRRAPRNVNKREIMRILLTEENHRPRHFAMFKICRWILPSSFSLGQCVHIP